MAEKSRALIKFGVALGVVGMLGGCPSAAVRPTPESTRSTPPSTTGLPPSIPTPPAPAPQRPPPLPPREIRLSPATQALVTQAHGLLSHGDMDGASSTLDRALRIEPNNPLLWIELGRVRLVESDSHQAESCARKALALASGDKAAQAQSGRLLVDALRAQERNQEAHEVESQPFMH